MHSLSKLLILLLPLVLTACGTSPKKGDTPFYQLNTSLLMNGKSLGDQSTRLRAGESRTLYFQNENPYARYKLDYRVMPGEQNQTVFIETHIYQSVKSPAFLAHENEEASFIFKDQAPEVELKVKAKQVPAE